MPDLRTFDQRIADSLRESQQSGELQTAKGWGKPLELNDGYDETPQELRMGFKALKDSGFVPPEVEMLKQLAGMRKQLESADLAESDAAQLRREIADLQLKVSVRMENLSRGG